MTLLDEKNFVKILEHEKNTEPDVYANKQSREYIDIEKAKSIIKLLLKNEKLNEFLISGFLEKYVEYVYKNKEQIESIPINKDNIGIDQNEYSFDFSDEDFRKMISKITIDEKHLPDEEIQAGCDAYKALKERRNLHDMITKKFLNKYALFVYHNRYQIRKLVSKDLCNIKIDNYGNYILNDNDFLEKINNDGGHNSPLWICINISQVKNDKGEKNFKDILERRINRIINLPENIANIIVDKEEDKILKQQFEEQSEDGVKVVKNDKIQNDIVVKNMLPENERETALIAEEIARQLGLSVAQYYPAKYIGSKYSKEMAQKNQQENGLDKNKELVYMTPNIVLTPNFLESEEELITGDRIAKYEMDISKVPDLIRKFLRKDGVSNSKIEDLISDYRIIMAYNCFINHRDGHNGNWGFVKNKNGDYKIAPIFDLEGSLDENVNNIRAVYIGDIFSGMGVNIDKHLFMHLLQDKKCKEKVQYFFTLSMSKVFDNVSISKGITISDNKKQRVTRVIRKEQEILFKVLKQINKSKKKVKNKVRNLEIDTEADLIK